jgi:hypothetical protein
MAQWLNVFLAQVEPGEGAVLAVAPWGQLLLYASQRGGVHAWDHRAARDAWHIPSVPQQVGVQVCGARACVCLSSASSERHRTAVTCCTRSACFSVCLTHSRCTAAGASV